MYCTGQASGLRTGLGAAGERTAGVNLGKADLRFPETVEKIEKRENGALPERDISKNWAAIPESEYGRSDRVAECDQV